MRRDRETLEAILHGGFVVLLEGFEYRVKLRLKTLRRIRDHVLPVRANGGANQDEHPYEKGRPHFVRPALLPVRRSSLMGWPASESWMS